MCVFHLIKRINFSHFVHTVMYSLCESTDSRLLTGVKAHLQSGCQINEEIDYYYGCVCREVAEYILHERGFSDGLYLLRQSNGDYVLSLCNSER